MATVKQALRVMRSHCLKLPGATEKLHYGESCFAAGPKIFAACGEKAGVGRIVVQLEPEHARRLVISNPRFAPYLRQKNCVWINVADIDDWDQIRSLVLESYRLNAPDPAAGDTAGKQMSKSRPTKSGPKKK
jgi:predicted DNA-binding protein (MmcQ/YjbR family)